MPVVFDSSIFMPFWDVLRASLGHVVTEVLRALGLGIWFIG